MTREAQTRNARKGYIYPLDDKYEDYLRDQSCMRGKADSISFPRSEAEITTILEALLQESAPITIQGGKTGLAGSAVPLTGHVMNLSKMNRVLSFSKTSHDQALLTVEAGITLGELQEAIRRLETSRMLWWPPDPSESTATVGGILSTGARGICSYLYGDPQAYCYSMRVMTADGSRMNIRREGPTVLVNERPRRLWDVYPRGEGMYGVITALTLRLVPRPECTWGIAFLFADEARALSFADHVGASPPEVEGAGIAAVVYLDRTTLDVLEASKHILPKLKRIPAVKTGTAALIYVEIHGGREEAVEETAGLLMTAFMHFGGDPEETWAFCGETQIEKPRSMLHAVVETGLMHIEHVGSNDPEITRLDFSVNMEAGDLNALVAYFRKCLKAKKLRAGFYGRMGSGLHITMLPDGYGEYVRGKAVLETWAENHADLPARPITAYAVGKLKKAVFARTASQDCLAEISALKARLDKRRIWNPGNMIPDHEPDP